VVQKGLWGLPLPRGYLGGLLTEQLRLAAAGDPSPPTFLPVTNDAAGVCGPEEGHVDVNLDGGAFVVGDTEVHKVWSLVDFMARESRGRERETRDRE
jgi:hypothetical protein